MVYEQTKSAEGATDDNASSFRTLLTSLKYATSWPDLFSIWPHTLLYELDTLTNYFATMHHFPMSNLNPSMLYFNFYIRYCGLLKARIRTTRMRAIQSRLCTLFANPRFTHLRLDMSCFISSRSSSFTPSCRDFFFHWWMNRPTSLRITSCKQTQVLQTNRAECRERTCMPTSRLVAQTSFARSNGFGNSEKCRW